MRVKNRIEERRQEQRYTRRQLADLTGVAWETIKSYEKKRATPSLLTAMRIADVLNLKMEDLYELVDASEEDEPEPEELLAK